MSKSDIIKRIVIELLSDRKMHCIQDISIHIKELCNFENLTISDTLISYNIRLLRDNNVIEKYGKFVRLK